MNKTKIGIFLSLLLLVGLTSCGEQKSNNKLMLNEILIDNQNNFQDDYGLHSAWIEIFNRSYGSADLAGCLLKVSSQPGDTVTYFIPKGDVLTLVETTPARSVLGRWRAQPRYFPHQLQVESPKQPTGSVFLIPAEI